MDVSAIAALATDMAQTSTVAEAQIAVLKKAMALEGQGALQLLQVADQALQAVSNPPHLGNQIDTFA